MSERDERADLKIIAEAFFDNLIMTQYEYGGIGLDSKRPFGNSDAEGDMCEMLDWEPEGDDGYADCYSSRQREYVADLYQQKLIPYLRELFKKWKEGAEDGR